MNLLTTATSLTFNPTSEILAIASRAEDEAARLVSGGGGVMATRMMAAALVNPAFFCVPSGPPAELHRLLQLPRLQEEAGLPGKLPRLLPAQRLLLIG